MAQPSWFLKNTVQGKIRSLLVERILVFHVAPPSFVVISMQSLRVLALNQPKDGVTNFTARTYRSGASWIRFQCDPASRVTSTWSLRRSLSSGLVSEYPINMACVESIADIRTTRKVSGTVTSIHVRPPSLV